jgi:glycine/D-amino acid oxidase-like deaminating enzyme
MDTNSETTLEHDHGLWRVTAGRAPSTPALNGEAQADVAVIGAGFTGLSAAVHAAEAGARVVVIDARYPGYGASGRNGGSVIPGFKLYPSELKAAYGEERARAMIDFGGSNVDFTFELIRRLGIQADVARNGWVYAAHSPVALPLARQRFDDLAKVGAPVQWLDRDALTSRLGTRAYFGGWLDKRGGSLQPLSYARGLAAAAMKKGVAIHGDSPAIGLSAKGNGWTVNTPKGSISAKHVIVGTNAYTDGLIPGLKHCVVPFQSAQVATAPLPSELLANILPMQNAVSDSRRSMLYFRHSPDGRFLMGGRGGVLVPTGDSHWSYLRQQAIRLYPQLARVQWEHAWSGDVAITPDYVPHFYEPYPNVHVGLGYYGRGVAMATVFGKLLADRALGLMTTAECPVPITQLEPMKLAPFKKLGAAVISKWYRMQDARELKLADQM